MICRPPLEVYPMIGEFEFWSFMVQGSNLAILRQAILYHGITMCVYGPIKKFDSSFNNNELLQNFPKMDFYLSAHIKDIWNYSIKSSK